MTEATGWRATTRKGRIRAELDEARLAAHRAGRVSSVLGRSADFAAPGVLNSTLGWAVFVPALSGGEVPALGDTDLPHSCTNVADVAAALATLAERPEGDSRVRHLPTAPAVSAREIHRMIEERAGVPLRTVPLAGPRPFGPFDRQFMDEYAEMFHQHTEPQIRDLVGLRGPLRPPAHPAGATLDATVEWYRALVSGAAA
jgi:nucleoside-diphosphate-sugar epimerase